MGDVIALRSVASTGACVIAGVRTLMDLHALDDRARLTALLVMCAELAVDLGLPRDGFVRCVGASYDVEIESR